MKTMFLVICVTLLALAPARAKEFIIFDNTVYFINGVSLADLGGQAGILKCIDEHCDGPKTITAEIMRMMVKQPGKKILLKEVDYLSKFSLWHPSTSGFYDLYGTLNGDTIIFQKTNFRECEGNYGFLIILGYILCGCVILFVLFAVVKLVVGLLI
jgi:hypothetical protein